MEVVADRGGTTGKRPGNRKAQIADAAGRLFCGLGYHRVGMEDIAASVGVTGRALYRHFGNKEELLAQVVSDGLTRLEAAVAAGLDDREGLDAVEAVTAELASLSSDARELGVLLQREARHLSAPGREAVRSRVVAIGERVNQALRRARPELSQADGALLVRSAFAALASPSYHAVSLSRTRSVALLDDMAMAVFWSRTVPWTGEHSAPSPSTDGSDRVGAGVAARASRREMLLSAAIGLFAQRGFSAVRMEDVGAAVGITGPSIYQHFPSKSDLLVAALTRGAEWLQFGMSRALQRGATSIEALERVVASYVEFVLSNSDLMHVLLNEMMYLPEAEQHSLRRVQHDYVAEWVRLLLAVRPELNEPEARFLTHGVLGIVNDNVQGGAEQVRPHLEDMLISLGLDVLAAGSRHDAAS